MAAARAPRALHLIAAALLAVACDVNVGNGEFNIGVASGRATDEWTRQYTIAAGGRLELHNVNGPITIEPSPAGGAVVVRAERTARAASDERARELLKQLEIREDVKPDSVRIETHAPSGWGRGHEVKYFVKAPPGIALNARTTNGAVQAAGLPNDIELGTTNGGIDAKGLSGAVRCGTTNGGIDVQLDGLAAGGVRLSTTNGGISLELPRDADADISARVTNGGIGAEDLQLNVRDKSRRTLEATLNDGGRPVELRTTNGGIRIRGK